MFTHVLSLKERLLGAAFFSVLVRPNVVRLSGSTLSLTPALPLVTWVLDAAFLSMLPLPLLGRRGYQVTHNCSPERCPR